MAVRTKRFGATVALIAAAISGSTLTLISTATAITAADQTTVSTAESP